MSDSNFNSPSSLMNNNLNNRYNSNNNSNINSNNNNNNSDNLDGSLHNPEINPLIFPEECLLQLEENVFTDNWSIPYKKDEILDRLLNSTIALLNNGIPDIYAENVKRFMDRVIPEVYRKLLDSQPVQKWNFDIQQGVYNMTNLVLELIVYRIFQAGVPDILLNTLSLIFNSESIFHNKNHLKVWDKSKYLEAFGNLEHCYTKDFNKHGWLLNLINNFALQKGFEGIRLQLENSSDLNEYNILLKPVATCCEFLNTVVIQSLFADPITKVVDFIKKLDEGFKDKNVGIVFELMQTLKKLSINFWPRELDVFHCMHLDIVLKYA
jgi:ubiquitin carboxyl-terminal hydrolase 9/24